MPEIGSTNSINIEKVAELSPDLVIAHKQLNAKDIPALKQLGINVLLTGAQSIDEINQSIEMLVNRSFIRSLRNRRSIR